MFPIAELSRFVVVVAAINILLVPCGAVVSYLAFGSGQVGLGLLSLSLTFVAARLFVISIDPLYGRS